MYTIFKKTADIIRAIEVAPHEEQAVARMEYLALNNIDPNALGYFVESGDLRLIAEWEI